MMRFRLLGNWKFANKFIQDLPRKVREASKDSQRDVANKLKKIVISHIKNNDIGLEPLSSSRLRQKEHSQPLLDTGDYIKNILVWNEGGIFYCGVKKTARNQKGESLYMIANILEEGYNFGNRVIPSRPVWKISIKELGKRDGIRKEVERRIKERLRLSNSRFTFNIDG